MQNGHNALSITLLDLTYISGAFKSSNISLNGLRYAIAASYLQLCCCKLMMLWSHNRTFAAARAICDLLERKLSALQRRQSFYS